MPKLNRGTIVFIALSILVGFLTLMAGESAATPPEGLDQKLFTII